MVFFFPIYDENRPSKKPYVTYGLVAVNVGLFLFFFLQGPEVHYGTFSVYGAVPSDILLGERLWTLLTSLFLHADVMHLASNMVFLWIFGDNIEDTFGHGKYLLFYLIGGFLAAFAHIGSTLISAYTSILPYFTPELDVPSIGASGAISAVLGAYILLYPHSRIRTLVYIVYIVTFASIRASYYLGLWFIYQVLMGLGALLGAQSTVAFWAHVGGYVYGIAVVKTLKVAPKMRQPSPRIAEPVRPLAVPLVIRPLVDVLVGDIALTVLAKMPGLEEKDIKIDVSERGVTLSAELKSMRFHTRVALPVRVVPRVENLIYRYGVLSFTLQRAI